MLKNGDLVIRPSGGKKLILGRGSDSPDHPAAIVVNPSGLVNIPNLDLADNAVTSAKIQDGQVGNADLANNAVNSAKIQDGQVTSADIANNTITEDDIADNFKARDADKLDGKDSSSFAAAGHSHDGRYYTKSTSDSRFVNAGGDTMSGNLNMGGKQINNVNSIQVGGQGTISDKKGRDIHGPDMVFETDDNFTFQQYDGYFSIHPSAPGTTLKTSGWLYMSQSVVPDTGYAYDLGDAGARKWRSIYVRDVFSGDISEDIDLDYKEPETGDILIWRDGKLVKSTKANDRNVFGVAKVTEDRPNGSPVILGVFVIKVTGTVHEGDFLVTSDVPGHAMAADNPAMGTVIATALESFKGKSGLIKAIIRKF